MREEQDLGVGIVHGWFTHGGDSILSTFLIFGEPLQKKLYRRRLTSLSHMICQDMHVHLLGVL